MRECDRALLLKTGFCKFFADRDDLRDSLGHVCPDDVFDDSYWARLEKYRALLVMFRIASKTAQSDSEPTLCQVVKSIVGLEQYCMAHVEDSPSWAKVKKRFLQAVQGTLRPETQKLCNATKACLLDPRNHGCRDWLGDDIYLKGWQELEAEGVELCGGREVERGRKSDYSRANGSPSQENGGSVDKRQQHATARLFS